jgi:hypothetical protein
MSYSPNFRGTSAAVPATATSTGYQNAVGGSVAVATAVSTNASGQFVLTDVTDESSSEGWLGLTAETIPNAATGQVMSDGRLINIPNLGFSNGDPIWVGLTPGSLTNVKPDLSQPGWAEGMWVLFVGVVVQNEFNSLQQDIQLCRQIIGQL